MLHRQLPTLVATTVLIALAPRAVDACSIAPEIVGPLANTVPVEGVLPIALFCSLNDALCSDPGASFDVLDGTGNTIPGTLVETIAGSPGSRRVTMAWKPVSGWTVGGNYHFRARTVMGQANPIPITVVAAVPPDRIVVTPKLEAGRAAGVGVRCGRSETSCGIMDQYFYPEMTRTAELSVALEPHATWSSQSALSLEAYSTVETPEKVELGLAIDAPAWSTYVLNVMGPAVFEGSAAKYCYRVLSRKLGQSATELVAEGCLPGGSLQEIGPINDPMEYGFDRCDGPVAGYESDWCSWMSASQNCTSSNRADFPELCAKYDSTCDGRFDSEDDRIRPGESGCQIASTSRSAPGLAWLFAGLAGFALRRCGVGGHRARSRAIGK